MGFPTTTTTTLVAAVFFFFVTLSLTIPSSSSAITTFKGIDVNNPVVDVTPSLASRYSSSPRGAKGALLCDRVRISGKSRLNLGSYASVFRVTSVPSVVIPEKLHNKIQICFHRNASIGLCQCEQDDWKPFQKGMWSTVMSPYMDRYIDVKFLDEVSGSVTVSLEEEPQAWRYSFLAIGLTLLILAPVVSNWVPFYYSSSMAIGIFLVILILLFQGMKLFPTGRKNVLYLTLYGSVLGAGSFMVHHFLAFVNTILVNFGLSQEMQNPVSVFILVGIILSGAGLGYWLVRKYVIKDGGVDVGVAQFVKWAMRVVAVTSIFQSTIDTPLAVAAVGSCVALCFLVASIKWRTEQAPSHPGNGKFKVRNGRVMAKHTRAEFLSPTRNMTSQRAFLNGPRTSFAWPDSPVKGLVSPHSSKGGRVAGYEEEDHYSTFHRTPNRKKFTKEEWEEFSEKSTKQAVAELAGSPEFPEWVISNADRIKMQPDDSSDEVEGSGSDSTDEIMGNEAEHGFFKWRRRK